MRFIICKKCKYNFEGECEFYIMGSGNDVDKPCRREEELVNRAANDFIDAFSADFVMDNLRGESDNAAEVVRCKDCECYDLKNYYCTYLDNSNGPDGFCNFGERKADE